MKITFLGTGAATAVPLPFCNCNTCNIARKLKGKDIRKRSSVIVNNDLLIDLGPDSDNACIEYDIELPLIKYVLQTHAHSDHFDAGHLITRHKDYAVKNIQPIMLISSPKTMEMINKKLKAEDNTINLFDIQCKKNLSLEIRMINHKDELRLGEYKITALESLHDLSEQSLMYLIEFREKSFLYATDLLRITEETYDLLKGKYIDAIAIDQTYGEGYNAGGHLDAGEVKKIINSMREINIIDNNTKVYATHISHEGNGIHSEMEKLACSSGYYIAYDGCTVDM